MCAYRIPGSQQYYTEDFYNDGEYGGGKALLELLRDEGYQNCVVFVARNHGGNKLGSKRLDIIKQAGQYALSAAQIVKEEKEKGTSKESLSTTSTKNLEPRKVNKRKAIPSSKYSMTANVASADPEFEFSGPTILAEIRDE